MAARSRGVSHFALHIEVPGRSLSGSRSERQGITVIHEGKFSLKIDRGITASLPPVLKLRRTKAFGCDPRGEIPA
ncbi:MAG: hypothetical protein ACM3UT_05145 [Chloroflexota bacterium]